MKRDACNEHATEGKRKRRGLANEPALFAEEKRDCFTLTVAPPGGQGGND